MTNEFNSEKLKESNLQSKLDKMSSDYKSKVTELESMKEHQKSLE